MSFYIEKNENDEFAMHLIYAFLHHVLNSSIHINHFNSEFIIEWLFLYVVLLSQDEVQLIFTTKTPSIVGLDFI